MPATVRSSPSRTAAHDEFADAVENSSKAPAPRIVVDGPVDTADLLPLPGATGDDPKTTTTTTTTTTRTVLLQRTHRRSVSAARSIDEQAALPSRAASPAPSEKSQASTATSQTIQQMNQQLALFQKNNAQFYNLLTMVNAALDEKFGDRVPPGTDVLAKISAVAAAMHTLETQAVSPQTEDSTAAESEVTSAETLREQLDELGARVRDAEALLQQKEDEIRAALLESAATVSTVRGENERLAAQVLAAEGARDLAAARAAQSDLDVASRDHQIAALELDLADAKAEHELEHASQALELAGVKEVHQRLVSAKDATLDERQQHVLNLEQQIVALNGQLATAVEASDLFQSERVALVEQLTTETSVLLSEKRDALERVDSLEAALAVSRAEFEASLAASRAEFEASLAASRQAHEAALASSRDEHEAALALSRDEHEATRAALKALQMDSAQKISALETFVKTERAETIKHKEAHAVAAAQLKDELEATRAETVVIKEEHTLEITRLVAALEASRSNVEAARRDMDLETSERDRRMAELEASVASFRSKADEATKALAASQAEVSESQTQIAEWQKKLEILTEVHVSAKTQAAQLESQLADGAAIHAAATERINALEKELAEAMEARAESVREQQDLVVERDALLLKREQAIAELEALLAAKQNEHAHAVEIYETAAAEAHAEIARGSERISELEALLDVSRSQAVGASRESLLQKDCAIAELEIALAHAQEARGQALGEHLEAMRAVEATASASAERHSVAAARLRSELVQLQTELVRMRVSHAGAVQSHSRQLGALRERLQALLDEQKNAAAEMMTVASASHRVEELEVLLATRAEELEDAQARRKALKARVAELEASVAVAAVKETADVGVDAMVEAQAASTQAAADLVDCGVDAALLETADHTAQTDDALVAATADYAVQTDGALVAETADHTAQTDDAVVTEGSAQTDETAVAEGSAQTDETLDETVKTSAVIPPRRTQSRAAELHEEVSASETVSETVTTMSTVTVTRTSASATLAAAEINAAEINEAKETGAETQTPFDETPEAFAEALLRLEREVERMASESEYRRVKVMVFRPLVDAHEAERVALERALERGRTQNLDLMGTIDAQASELRRVAPFEARSEFHRVKAMVYRDELRRRIEEQGAEVGRLSQQLSRELSLARARLGELQTVRDAAVARAQELEAERAAVPEAKPSASVATLTARVTRLSIGTQAEAQVTAPPPSPVAVREYRAKISQLEERLMLQLDEIAKLEFELARTRVSLAQDTAKMRALGASVAAQSSAAAGSTTSECTQERQKCCCQSEIGSTTTTEYTKMYAPCPTVRRRDGSLVHHPMFPNAQSEDEKTQLIAALQDHLLSLEEQNNKQAVALRRLQERLLLGMVPPPPSVSSVVSSSAFGSLGRPPLADDVRSIPTPSASPIPPALAVNPPALAVNPPVQVVESMRATTVTSVNTSVTRAAVN